METGTATQATEVLIREYSKLVFHVIYGLTGNWQESEDLTQETFLQAFRGIDAARAASGSQFQGKAWLLRIAVNTVRMSRRRLHAIRFFTFSELESDRLAGEGGKDTPLAIYEEIPEAGDLETSIAERDTVQHCMELLPETLRIPLLLSVVAGFSTSELAGMLALNEATARQRLSRARKAFQRLYAQACGEHISIEKATRSATRASRSRNHARRRPAAFLLAGL